MNERILGIKAKVTKWHNEDVDGKQIRVIDEWDVLGVSIIPDGEYPNLFTYDVSRRLWEEYLKRSQ